VVVSATSRKKLRLKRDFAKIRMAIPAKGFRQKSRAADQILDTMARAQTKRMPSGTKTVKPKTAIIDLMQ
jgi:hypothetical protein